MTFAQPTFAAHLAPNHSRRQKTVRVGLALAIIFVAATASAAGMKSQTSAELNAAYQQEKAACNNGKSHQDRATCLREAGAAYQQAKQGKLSDDAQAQFHQNALARCNALPARDQADCQRRIDDPTEIDGSVADGGILRKDVTIVPAD